MQEERAVFRERIRQIDPKDLVFVDETGIATAMTRLYARAPRRERGWGSAPCGHWRRLTVPGALSGEGMGATMSIAAAATTQVFLAFLRAVPVPEPRRRHPKATVLMDNWPAHAEGRRDHPRRGRAQAHLPAALLARPLADRTRPVKD